MNKKDNKELIKVQNLKKYFPIKKGVFRSVVGHVKAVDGIDFYINEGETLGLVGESGCGKTTTGRCLIRLIEPTAGKLEFRTDMGMIDLIKTNKKRLREIRKDIQMIFQDPFSSLNPRKSVYDIVSDPLRVYNIDNKRELVADMLNKAGLSPEIMNRYPHAFSGGQRQRIGIARSLILKPRLVICDEPVSALDVSVQAQVINLLKDLQDEMDLTYLFIAHDLSVVEYISERVMVMYLGKIVEVAPFTKIYSTPEHPYTEALLSSIPNPDPDKVKKRIILDGNVPDPANPPQGCNFHQRCKYAKDICREKEPELIDVKENCYSACHFADELELNGYDISEESQTGKNLAQRTYLKIKTT